MKIRQSTYDDRNWKLGVDGNPNPNEKWEMGNEISREIKKKKNARVVLLVHSN